MTYGSRRGSCTSCIRLAIVVHRFSWVPAFNEYLTWPTRTDRQTYKLDGDLRVIQKVRSFEDNAETTLSDLLSDAIVHTDNIGRRGCHFDGS